MNGCGTSTTEEYADGRDHCQHELLYRDYIPAGGGPCVGHAGEARGDGYSVKKEPDQSQDHVRYRFLLVRLHVYPINRTSMPECLLRPGLLQLTSGGEVCMRGCKSTYLKIA